MNKEVYIIFRRHHFGDTDILQVFDKEELAEKVVNHYKQKEDISCVEYGYYSRNIEDEIIA